MTYSAGDLLWERGSIPLHTTMKYKVKIVFKHLMHWVKFQEIEAKSEKKALDVVRRMYKDKIYSIEIVK